MKKANEHQETEKRRAKLAVFPPALPAAHRDHNTIQPEDLVSDPGQQSMLANSPAMVAEIEELEELKPALLEQDAGLETESPVARDEPAGKAPRLMVVDPTHLTEQERDPLQEITEFHRELEDEPQGLYDQVANLLSGWGASFVCHTLILIALALLTIRSEEPNSASITLNESADQQALNTESIDVKVDLKPLETSASSELQEELDTDLAEEFTAETLAASETEFEIPEFEGDLPSIAGSGLADGFGRGAKANRRAKGKGIPGKSADFFGAYADGTEFIFVIDCSGSMQGERWERAVYELERSILDLNDEQKFCILLYNRFTVIMGNAKRIELVNRTDENFDLAITWLRQQTPSGGTFPRQALSLALDQHPDAIFLLSDGIIQDNSDAFLQANNKGIEGGVGEKRQIPVHTVALLSNFGQSNLKKIADGNEGTFTRVDR